MSSSENNIITKQIDKLDGNTTMKEEDKVPNSKKSKLKIISIIILILLIIVVLLLGIKTIFCTPKSIFKQSINYIYNQSVNRIDETDKLFEKYDFLEKAITLDFDAVFDTNIEELSAELDDKKIETKDYIIGGNIGFDLKDFEAIAGVSLKNDKMSIVGNFLFEQGDIYIHSNILDNPILAAPASEEELKEFKEEFKEFEKELEEITSELELDSKSYKYVLKTFKNALIKSLNFEKMKKDQTTIEIDNKEIKVNKISYQIDEELLEETVDTVVNILLEDDKFIENVSKISQIDKAKIKDFLREMKDEVEDVEINEDVYINIYVKGLFNKFVGFSFEVEDAGYISYVKTKEKSETIYYEEYERYDYNEDEYVKDERKIVLLAENKSDVTELSLRYDNETIVTADIRSLVSENIDFDYKIYIDDDFTIGGTLKLTQTENENGVKGKYKFKLDINKEYLSVEGKYEFKVTENLEKFNTSNHINIEEIDEETIKNNLLEELKKDPALYEQIQKAIKNQELEELLNDYDMYEYEKEADAIALKNNLEPTVLFIDYYDYEYNYDEKYITWEYLYDLQLQYDFHTYYIHPQKLTTDFWTNYNIVNSCESDVVTENYSCTPYPIIILIKNGQIVKTLKGNHKYKEIEKSLLEIGIN